LTSGDSSSPKQPAIAVAISMRVTPNAIAERMLDATMLAVYYSSRTRQFQV
jgi:hypothetical protein